MIPDEAVEAAAIAGYEAGTGESWSGLDDAGREHEWFAAQCALEAAAPNMLADAWDRGMHFSASLLNGEELANSFRKDNPYKAAK